MNKYRKLFTAVVVPALVFGLDAAGMEIPPGWAEGVIMVASPFFVWLVPNAT